MRKYLSLLVGFLIGIILIGCEEEKDLEQYTITFDSDGGSLVSEQVIIEGEKVVKPTSPVKEGFIFDGWYDRDTLWNFDEDIVNSNITLKARWSLKLPESLEITGNKILEVGDSIDLTVVVMPVDTSNEVIWESSNENIASVNEKGVVTAISKGVCIITATSKTNPNLSSNIELTVTEEEIIIEGPKTVYYGYSDKLTANVYTLQDNKIVVWSSLSPVNCLVDENGVVEGIGLGKAKVKCELASNPEVYEIFEFEVVESPSEATTVDMQGYQIVIMQASSAIQEIDPFNVDYKYDDKLAKQKAWKEAEDKFNCDIAVKAYPDSVQWGTPRQQYIIDGKKYDNVSADLYVISSIWIRNLVKNDTAVDVSSYYEKYGRDQMEPGKIGAGTYKDGLYIANTGIDGVTNYIDHGLYYNVEKISEYGVEDPAKMFNEGRWTYSNFEKWANELQSKLPEDIYAIGGHPYYYFLGMNAAANINIIDYKTLNISVDSQVTAEAMSLLNRLIVSKAMNNNNGSYDVMLDGGFHSETTMMIAGRYYNLQNSSYWYEGMWEEGEYPNIGFVPYPYPDNMKKEDTRVSTTGGTVYMYAKGRKYGEGFGVEEVYRVITEMYLNSIVIQKIDSNYDSEEILKEKISKNLSNEASIEAAMFYNAKRVIYEPTEEMYVSIASSPLYTVVTSAVYEGKDYINEVSKVKEKFKEDVLNNLG